MKRFFTHNVGLKLLALGLSVFLWIIVIGEAETVRAYPVPAEFRLPVDQVVTSELPATVSVALRGPEILLARVDPSALAVALDLRGEAPGERRIELSPTRHLRGLPPGLAVSGISPHSLSVQLERKLSRSLPVVPLVEGRPGEGCRVVGFATEPAGFVVEGPESEVASLSRLETGPIDITGHCETLSVPAAASAAATGVRILDPRPVTVTVTIEGPPETDRIPGAFGDDAGSEPVVDEDGSPEEKK